MTTASDPPASPRRIFLVEDDEHTARALQLLLSSRGFEVCGHATRAEDAIGQIVTLRPDVVIVDIHLSTSMTGINLVEQLRGVPDLAMIFLTASDQPAVAQRIAATGASGYLVKPVHSEVLIANIELAIVHRDTSARLRDVHAQLKMTHAKLLESEAWARRVVDHVTDAIVIDDLDGNLVFASDRFLELFDCSRDALARACLEDFARPEWRARLRERHDRLVRGEPGPMSLEFQRSCRDGEAPWIEVRAVPVRNQEGQVIGTQSALTDITTRKRAEIERRDREEFLALSQEVAHVGSWEWDVRANRITWSDEMCRLHGQDPRTFVPTLDTALALYDPDDRVRVASGIERSLKGGRNEPAKFRVVVDGEARTHWVTWRTYFDENAQPYRMVGVNFDITEQEKRTEQLELAQFSIDQASDGFHLVTADGRFLAVNDASCRLLGYSRAELLTMTVDDIVPNLPASAGPAHWADRLARGAFSCESRARRKDGTPFPIEVNVTHLRFRGHEYHAVVMRDISQRKQAESDLRLAREHYESLFNEALEGIFRTEVDGTIVAANSAFARIVGYERAEDLHGTSAQTLYRDPLDRQRLAQEHAGDDVIEAVEIQWQKKNGEAVTVELHGRVLHDEHGHPVGYQGFVRDVTEVRARAARERLLLEHKEQLELIIEGTRLGFWDWNPQTDEFRFSERLAEMIGYRLEELDPRMASWASRIHPADRFAYDEALREHLEGTSPFYENVHRMRHKDGRWVYVLDRGKVFKWDEDGRPTRFCGTHTDITKEKGAEVSELEANRAKTSFLASMSHELRTPLNAVLGLSEALLERVYGELTEKQERSLRTVHESGKHLLDRLNDVLDIARVEAGKLILAPSNISISPFIEECIAFVREPAAARTQRLLVEVDSAVAIVRADPRRLRQLLLYLLSNAIKFSPPGASITVGAAASTDRRYLELSVADTGPGISSANRSRIFEPFMRLDESLARETQGVGLGLALVKRIAELHGGSARVESEPGHGSRFIVTLPAPPGDEPR